MINITSTKHQKGKERVALKRKSEQSIVEALKQYDQSEHPKGGNLPDATRVFRVRVVTLLKSGISLNKADGLRELLEENGYSLTSSTHLRQFVPFVLQEEIKTIKKEIAGKQVSIIFDGTTHVTEAFVIILGFLDDWNIKQRVTKLMLFAKSLTGENVARLLVESLCTELGLGCNAVIAAMHDRASVNTVAMHTISVVYNCIFDVGCLSHTIDHVGEHLSVQVLNDFIKVWITLFSHSPKTRLAWTTLTGLRPPSYSPTRWWSKFEVINQIHDIFGDVTLFFNDPTIDLPAVSKRKLINILNDPAKCRKLKVELAITVDALKPFVCATYNLEGDGALAVSAYQQISKLYSTIECEHYPNVMALAKHESNGNSLHEQQLVRYAKECVKTAYEYFNSKFDLASGDLKDTVLAFRAARYLVPSMLNELKPTVNDIENLKLFPFLNESLINKLKDELPSYRAAVENVSSEIDTVLWWKSHEHELPNWANALQLLLLVQPSSAAAERAFSLLENSFNHQQRSSLEDYISVSVMLQYNRK